VEAFGGGGVEGNRRRRCCTVAVGVGGWVGEVVGAHTRPKEASADWFKVGVDQSAVARTADTAATFLGAAAARSVEAGLRGRTRRCPRRGCSGTRARWFGASAAAMASGVRHAVQSRAGA
jgi:hypothetical protein